MNISRLRVSSYNEALIELRISLEFSIMNAFKKLGYEKPELEAKLLLINIDGLATRMFLQKNFDTKSIIEFLYTKYNL